MNSNELKENSHLAIEKLKQRFRAWTDIKAILDYIAFLESENERLRMARVAWVELSNKPLTTLDPPKPYDVPIPSIGEVDIDEPETFKDVPCMTADGLNPYSRLQEHRGNIG